MDDSDDREAQVQGSPGTDRCAEWRTGRAGGRCREGPHRTRNFAPSPKRCRAWQPHLSQAALRQAALSALALETDATPSNLVGRWCNLAVRRWDAKRSGGCKGGCPLVAQVLAMAFLWPPH